MTTKDLGIVRLVPKGDWSATVNYQYLNIVRYNGASYIATSASIGIAPDSSNGSTYWQLISQDVGNAIQEELSVIESNIQNNANNIKNQETLIQNNANDIKNLFAITAPTYTEITVAQAYTSRVTADGANIFDDQLTPVLEIAGSTVKTTNLFDISAVVSKTAITTTDREITLTNIDNTSVGDMKSLFPNLTVGKTYTLVCTVEGDPAIDGALNGTIYTDGDRIALLRVVRAGLQSAYFTLTQSMYNSSIRFYGLTDGTVTWKDLRCFEGQYTTATAPEWTPYFAGLKHAYINSIVSTGKNLCDVSKIVNSSTLTNNGDGSITTTAALSGTSCTLKQLCPNIQAGVNYTLSLNSDNSSQTIPLIRLIKLGTETGIDWYTGVAKSFTEDELNYTVYIYGYLNGTSLAGQPCTTRNIQVQIGNVATEYTPYVEPSIFQLPQTVELPEYDKILPQTGEIVRATGYATSEAGFTDEEIATYNNAVVSNDRKSLVYEIATATTTPINAPKWYESWNKGNETIVQGETDNSQFGAMPTVTQTYFGKVGEE